MFDTVLVATSLIDPLVDGDLRSELESTEQSYYYFQTKDLDNFLNSYYIEADNKLWVEEVEYEQDGLAKPSPLGVRVKSTTKRYSIETTQYVNFYNCFDTTDYFVEIEFKAHVVDGEVKSLKLVKCEKTHQSAILARNANNQLKWERIQSTWEYRLAGRIDAILWKIKRWFINPVERYIYRLRDSVRKQYFDQWKKN